MDSLALHQRTFDMEALEQEEAATKIQAVARGRTSRKMAKRKEEAATEQSVIDLDNKVSPIPVEQSQQKGRTRSHCLGFRRV